MGRSTAALTILAGVLAACEPAAPPPSPPAAARSIERSPRTFALLINGGASRARNYQSHVLHLRELYAYLQAQGIPGHDIWIFTSDGPDPAPDLAVREVDGEQNFWLVEGTSLERSLRHEIRYENTAFDRKRILPATRRALGRWARRGAQQRLRTGDTLLVYVTDHGQLNRDDPEQSWINLWEERLSVDEFRTWLGELPEGVRVISLMSQCYSGAFAHAMYRDADDTASSGQFCGYFSSSAERPAYGCYPENRGKHNVGHSFHFFEALRLHGGFSEAHARVLVTDQTPDVPNRTSDRFLEEVLAQAAREKGVELEPFVDELLSQHGKDPAYRRLFAQVDRIGHAFGAFAPRSLAELGTKARNLPRLEQELESYSRRWGAALDDLRHANVEDFLAVSPRFARYADVKHTRELGGRERKRIVKGLLRELHAFTERDPVRSERLASLRRIAAESEQASYRMAVRRAVELRLRALLVRIAGLAYVEQEADRELRARFDELVGCEDLRFTTPSVSAAQARLPDPFPRLEDEQDLLARVLPGWIGIEFEPLSPEIRAERGLGAGAARIVRVVPGAPASEAGLRAGDVILGPPGAPFREPHQIREWVMTSVVGERRSFAVLRGARPLVFTVVIGKAPI